MKNFAKSFLRHVRDDGKRVKQKDWVVVISVEVKTIGTCHHTVHPIQCVQDCEGFFLKDRATDLCCIKSATRK